MGEVRARVVLHETRDALCSSYRHETRGGRPWSARPLAGGEGATHPPAPEPSPDRSGAGRFPLLFETDDPKTSKNPLFAGMMATGTLSFRLGGASVGVPFSPVTCISET
jgi:hypothetical protein